MSASVCVFMSFCVCERERKREGERGIVLVRKRNKVMKIKIRGTQLVCSYSKHNIPLSYYTLIVHGHQRMSRMKLELSRSTVPCCPSLIFTIPKANTAERMNKTSLKGKGKVKTVIPQETDSAADGGQRNRLV